MKRLLSLTLLLLLMISILSLTGCMVIPFFWEVNSHEDFAKEIEKYNSINNGSIDTFISFDFDENPNVSKSIYYFWTSTGYIKLVRKYGFYDIYDRFYDVSQIFYLKSDADDVVQNENAYKIKYSYTRNHTQNNFAEEDKIEIKISADDKCHQFYDLYYQESFSNTDYTNDEDKIYNYCYYYNICANDMERGCIHISSIEEMSEEKLEEIRQMLLDNLVIINTED